eukprot:scaffold4126_cov383-Prasinococcus_capsulatus_cf.AAC.8
MPGRPEAVRARHSREEAAIAVPRGVSHPQGQEVPHGHLPRGARAAHARQQQHLHLIHGAKNARDLDHPSPGRKHALRASTRSPWAHRPSTRPSQGRAGP